MNRGEYACPECEGWGKIECVCCGSETECPECKGSGWDPEKIDLPLFVAAEKEIFGRTKCTWEWIENGVSIGRRGDTEFVRVSDFLLKPESGGTKT